MVKIHRINDRMIFQHPDRHFFGGLFFNTKKKGLEKMKKHTQTHWQNVEKLTRNSLKK